MTALRRAEERQSSAAPDIDPSHLPLLSLRRAGRTTARIKVTRSRNDRVLHRSSSDLLHGSPRPADRSAPTKTGVDQKAFGAATPQAKPEKGSGSRTPAERRRNS